MNSTDISRLLLQPRKHYSGVRLQQGRVVLDSDFNELAAIGDDDQWRVLRDLIGPTGSPNDGFSLALTVGEEVIPRLISYNGADFVSVLPYRLNSGALYICGVRFTHDEREIDSLIAGDPVALQRDYLQMTESETPLSQPGTTHTQLAWVHAWEQCVTSVEDHEFHEFALGDLDTSTRVRRMTNIHVDEVDNDLDCQQAWAIVRERIESATGGVFDADGTCLQSAARLRVVFNTGAALDACAPCSPDDPGRFLGADNQAVRIMLVSSTEYVWSTDNASPVYRVLVGDPDDARVTVKMLSLPRDEAHWPLRNTVAEFLPWGALLNNGQKVAQEPGIFIRIDEGFDPDTGSFKLSEADAAQLQTLTRVWDDEHPDRAQLPNDNDPEGNFLYLRLWHRIDSDTDPVLLSTTGSHELLLRLGLQPQFTGNGNAGDYWTLAVRPNTPRTIVPWDLTQAAGVPPHGPKHLYSPLSLVTFRPPESGEHENAEVVESIEDCRLRFRPLTGQAGCCKYSVGDGVSSYGDYASIQIAIDQLPPEGGIICVLPGNYIEEVTIDRDNVIVEGCGIDTRISAPTGEPGRALFQLNGSNIELREFTLLTSGQIGVRVNQEDLIGGIASNTIKLRALQIFADQRAVEDGQTRSGIDIRRAQDVVINECLVTMDGSISDDAAVFLRGEDIKVTHCRIESLPVSGTSSAWAGVQVGGESKRVVLERNEILGGLGHAITLGSLIWESETSTVTVGAGTGLVDTQDPCAPTSTTVQPVEIESVRYDPRSAGDLADIRIIDNQLEGFSANGISVLTLMPLADDGGNELITTDRVLIERNRIINNVDQSSNLSSNSPTPKVKKLEAGDDQVFGKFLISDIPPAGIVLVDGNIIEIRDNIIRDNGVADPEPLSGVCIIYGNGIVIEGNRIQNNGLRDPGTRPAGDMSRAGICISLAGIASNQATPDQSDSLGSSLRVIGNTVEHPNGPALVVRATGPVLVEGNQLESLGSNATAHQAGVAHCVSIDDVGRPFEAIDLAAGEPSADRWEMPDGTSEYLQRETDPANAEQRIGHGGRVLFSNNHVSLQWVEPTGVSSGLAGGFSVGICSLDDVTCSGNQFSLNVEDPGLKKGKGGETALNRQPRISAHVVLVGATASASQNRVAEGVNDALISLLVLGGFLVSSTNNVCTHAALASTCNTFTAGSSDPLADEPNERVDRNNLVWLTPTAESSGVDLVSQETVNATANQLFSSLCASCLGIGTVDFSTFNVFAILTRETE